MDKKLIFDYLIIEPFFFFLLIGDLFINKFDTIHLGDLHMKVKNTILNSFKLLLISFTNLEGV